MRGFESRRSARSDQGFSLVGLVVSLTIVVTLSGVAAIFYDSILSEQKSTIARNELDDLTKAVRAYVLMTRKSLSPDQLTDDKFDKDIGDGLDTPHYSLDFLVRAGIYGEQRQDPWGRWYRLDPFSGVVYSMGPDVSDSGDDLRRSYSRSDGSVGGATDDVITVDNIPPVISSIQPVGVVKVSNPQVRATFYDHFGGTINQGPNNPKMFIDAQDVSMAPGIDSSGVGQIVYTTPVAFSEGTHVVVVQVEDSNKNLARREWNFTVDTKPAIARVHLPVQGSALKLTTAVSVFASDDNLKKVTVRLDFKNVSSRFRGVGTPAPPYFPAATAEYPTGYPGASPANQQPPNSGQVKHYPGLWDPWDTRTTDPDGVADGVHYFTCSAEDFAGRVISEQIQITVDNTPPSVAITLGIHPGSQPPTAGNPQVVPTAIPHFEARGLDNLRIKNVSFRIFDQNLGVYQSRKGSVILSTWEPLVPLDWAGLPINDWPALFNSPDETASTTSSVAAFIPVTLNTGRYILEVQAEDLAGNFSAPNAKSSTEFIVDLTLDGLAGLVMYDKPGTPPVGLPVSIADRTLSSLHPNDPEYIALNSAYPGTIQTVGHLAFNLLRGDTGGKISGIIGDYLDFPTDRGGISEVPFQPYTTSTFGDWIHVVPMPTTSGPQNLGDYRVHGLTPDSTPLGPPAKDTSQSVVTGRRNDPPNQNMQHGAYRAKVELDYSTSADKFQFTTFYLDNALFDFTQPDIWQYQLPGGTLTLLSANSIIGTLSTTNSPQPTLRLGGRIRDRMLKPSSTEDFMARMDKVFARIHYGTASPAIPITSSLGWVEVYPNGAAQTQVATYGAALSLTGDPGLNLTSGTILGLEGPHTVDIKGVDGAGHTTAMRRSFIINSIGPIVNPVTILNAQGGPEVISASGSTTVTVNDSFVRLQFQATDQVPVNRFEYRLVEIGGPGSLGSTVVPQIPATPNAISIVIDAFQDQVGSVFRSDPVSYRLEVFAASDKPGALFTCNIKFKFLVDLAIFAPLYNDSTGIPAISMSKAEQIAVADYLFDNVENVRSAAVFDRNGKIKDRPVGSVSQTKILTWMMANKGDLTTDVLVILDGPLTAMCNPTLAAFGNGPTRDNPDRPVEGMMETTDGDVVIWSGGPGPFGITYPYPPATTLETWAGTDESSEGTARIFDHDSFDTTREERAHADLIQAPGGEAVQVASPLAKLLLPSLGTYRPDGLVVGTTTDNFVAKSVMGAHGRNTPGSNWGDWSIEHRFTVDNRGSSADTDITIDDFIPGGSPTTSNHSGDPSLQEGANYVIRDSRGGRFAAFLSYGHKLVNTQDRLPAQNTGPVIEEFIENYLSAFTVPDGVSAKVAFAARAGVVSGGRQVPSTATSEVNAWLWPVFGGGLDRYRDLTPYDPGREVMAVQDISPDGSNVLVISNQLRSTDNVTVQPDNMVAYIVSSGITKRVLYKNLNVGNGFTLVTNPQLGRLASSGTGAVVVGDVDQINPITGNQLPAKVAWYFDLASNAVTPATTGRIGGGDVKWADISGSGRYVLSISNTKYPNLAAGPLNNFTGATLSTTATLMRFDTGTPPQFTNGWVNNFAFPDTRAPPLDAGCSGFFNHVQPLEAQINSNGDQVVWIGQPTDPDCMNNQAQILVSQKIGAGNEWATGQLTDCASDCGFADVGFATRFDMSDASDGGTFPRVVFRSTADFRVDGSTCSGCNANPALSPGQIPASYGGNPALYMWNGSLEATDRFFDVAKLTGAGFLGNPRISADGKNFVFEIKAAAVQGLLGWDQADPSPSTRGRYQVVDVGNGGAGPSSSWTGSNHKVVKGRFSVPPSPMRGASSILQIVVPFDDVGQTALDGVIIPDQTAVNEAEFPDPLTGRRFVDTMTPAISN